jgi:hypothetical protein
VSCSVGIARTANEHWRVNEIPRRQETPSGRPSNLEGYEGGRTMTPEDKDKLIKAYKATDFNKNTDLLDKVIDELITKARKRLNNKLN